MPASDSDPYDPDYSLLNLPASAQWMVDLVNTLSPDLIQERNAWLSSGRTNPVAVFGEDDEALTIDIRSKLRRKMSTARRIQHTDCTDPKCPCKHAVYFILSSKDLGTAGTSSKLPPFDKPTIRSRVYNANTSEVLPVLIAFKDVKEYVELPLDDYDPNYD